MTIDELGALGGFIGSVAVLVTLVYLAVQIRRNTRHVRAQMAMLAPIVGARVSTDEMLDTPGGTGRAASRFDRVAVGSIVVRCFEYDRMVAFWQAALGYEVEHRDPNGGFVILRDPEGRGPNVSIDQAPERRSGKRSWLHLDLYTTNQASEVERLVGLGARRYPWRSDPGADYVVLEDPDGNLFCVVEIEAAVTGTSTTPEGGST